MTAHSAINTSTEIRQSDSNRFGRVIVAVSIVGCSRLGVEPEFIAEILIIREQERPQSAATPRGTRSSATSR